MVLALVAMILVAMVVAFAVTLRRVPASAGATVLGSVKPERRVTSTDLIADFTGDPMAAAQNYAATENRVEGWYQAKVAQPTGTTLVFPGTLPGSYMTAMLAPNDPALASLGAAGNIAVRCEAVGSDGVHAILKSCMVDPA